STQEAAMAKSKSHTEAVSHAAVDIATSLGAKAILTTSTSGATPRVVSKHKPQMPILTVCWHPRVHPQLSLVWGVEAVNADMQMDTDQAMSLAIQLFLRHKSLKLGDTVVITAGYPVGAAGNTNLILVRTV
ncbi:MAG: pyruvate kinase alpha/beta domain-containing protein, partial [Armatimonadota bacterium]